MGHAHARSFKIRLFMAIIRSGFLFGLFRSASGLTFYKRQGTSAVRSKPVRSLDWEPSELQRFYQLVFSKINDFVKTYPRFLSLVEGGWGWSRRGNSSTNLNNVIGYIFRSITRVEGGARRPQEESNVLFGDFLDNPINYFISRCQMTVPIYPIVGEPLLEDQGNGTYRIYISISDVNIWRDKVSKISGRFRSNSPVFFQVGGSVAESGGNAFLLRYRALRSADGWYITLNAQVIEESIWQIALAINEDDDATVNNTSGWAISPVFASSSLRSDADPGTGVVITSIVSNGVTIARNTVWRLVGGSQVTLYGRNLDVSTLFVVDGDGAGMIGEPARITSFFSLTSSSSTSIVLATRQGQDGAYVIRIQDNEGHVLYQLATP